MPVGTDIEHFRWPLLRGWLLSGLPPVNRIAMTWIPKIEEPGHCIPGSLFCHELLEIGPGREGVGPARC